MDQLFIPMKDVVFGVLIVVFGFEPHGLPKYGTDQNFFTYGRFLTLRPLLQPGKFDHERRSF
jgi:hypothetical protein